MTAGVTGAGAAGAGAGAGLGVAAGAGGVVCTVAGTAGIEFNTGWMMK